jgi:hypothetical protein
LFANHTDVCGAYHELDLQCNFDYINLQAKDKKAALYWETRSAKAKESLPILIERGFSFGDIHEEVVLGIIQELLDKNVDIINDDVVLLEELIIEIINSINSDCLTGNHSMSGWMPDASDSSRHFKRCTKNSCSYQEFGAHNSNIVSNDGPNGHNLYCSICNAYRATVSHSYTIISIHSMTQHKHSCICGYYTLSSHSMSWSRVSNAVCKGTCRGCPHVVTQNHEPNAYGLCKNCNTFN